MPPTVTVSAWEARNPAPEIVAVVPTTPDTGLSPASVGVTPKLVVDISVDVPSETTTGSAPPETTGVV